MYCPLTTHDSRLTILSPVRILPPTMCHLLSSLRELASKGLSSLLSFQEILKATASRIQALMLKYLPTAMCHWPFHGGATHQGLMGLIRPTASITANNIQTECL